jgi:hypothetical protein
MLCVVDNMSDHAAAQSTAYKGNGQDSAARWL